MPSQGHDSMRSKSINGSQKEREESFDDDIYDMEARVGKMSLKVVREFIR
jgi:hypothetical protein